MTQPAANQVTRTMYDAAYMAGIPATAKVVAGYPHAFAPDFARFPDALQVRIDQHGDHPDDCHVADVENGAISMSYVRDWVTRWHALHPNGMDAVNGFFARPTVYVSYDSLTSLRRMLDGLQYDVWVAWWGTGPTIIPGTVAHQYVPAPASGGQYDVTVIYDPEWGVKPSSPPPTWQDRALSDLAFAQWRIGRATDLIKANDPAKV